MPLSKNTIGKVLTIALMLMAWFGLTNHCALAATFAATPMACAECPMHSAAKKLPARQKKSADDAPCCRNLHVLISKPTKSIQDFVGVAYKPIAHAAPAWLPPEAIAPESVALDTGPPPARGFVELTLQRSLFAHAPPSFA